MPSCVFRKCTNNTKNTNKTKGITFHSFPRDPHYKDIWIKIIQRDQRDDQWLPTKFSRVCSVHFNENDIYLTPLGRRKLKIPAIPVCDAYWELYKNDDGNYGYKSETQCSPSLRNVHVSNTKQKFDSPRKQFLKRKLNIEKRKREKCRKEILKLKEQNKYLKLKITSLREIVMSLKNKKYFSKEILNELTCKADEANKDFLLAIATKKRIISPNLRKFYAALHYYSPDAYKYIRGQLNNILPHSRTIAKWYEKTDVSPGFTQQAFEKLKRKFEQISVIATLVVDEMALSQRASWSDRKTMGLVNEGLGPKDEIATQAYVFMLVSNTENWKIPLGYFLINGLRAEQRANLIKMCISRCYDVGVNVVALTFDGCSANVATAEILGCNFQNIDNLETTFPHPACSNIRVAVLFDACHMLKLVRSTFEAKKVFISDVGRVEWLYVVKLLKLQEKERFKFANKLTVRHIAFRNQIMKVNPGCRLLSGSVAKALALCSEMLTGSNFKNVEATVEFIEIFDNLFDIFNSTRFQQGFKRPLGPENANEILNCLDKVENYIKRLKLYNKVKISRGRRTRLNTSQKFVTKAKCNMGFLGLLIDIQSLKFLYSELVEQNKATNYLSTYGLSQDNVELFFVLMRQHGGHNNNPTTEQFRDVYKKAISHLELRSSFKGNCFPVDNFSLSFSSPLENINMTTTGFRDTESDLRTNEALCAEDRQCEVNSDILASLLDKEKDLSEISKPIVGYISGWVVKKIVKKLRCQTCCSVLMSEKRLRFHRLITLRNLGGLFLSSLDVFDICSKTEIFLKHHKKQHGNHYIRNQKEYKVIQTKVLKSFIDSNIFHNIGQHSMEQPATWNHRIQLIKLIITSYAEVRLHYLDKNVIQANRQKNYELILF